MRLSNIIFGLILLGFGRRLFWLFVAIAGFLVGIEFAGVILTDQPEWVLLVVGICAGLLGALLAVFAERVAFALGGFLGGGYLALLLAHSLDASGMGIGLFVLGGLVGAIFAGWIMDWAIIVLSCLVGAGAVVRGVDLGETTSVIVFFVLAFAGAVVQSRLMTRSRAG